MPVPEGRPFCPQCRAPQVRVEVSAPPVEDRPVTTVTEAAPLTTPDLVPAAVMDETRLARSAVLKAGFLGVLLGIIPFFGSLLTGIAAVWFYRRAGGTLSRAGIGTRLGAFAAAVSVAISAVLTFIQVFVLRGQKQYEEAMLRVLSAFGANLSDPEVQASVHTLFTPSGIVLSVIVGLIVAVALGAFGGAVAGSSRRTRQ